MPANLTVSLIQTNPFWEDISANLQLFEEKISLLARGQLVVLPEMFSTGFSMHSEKLAEEMDGQTVNWMKRMAGQQQIILTGSLIIREKEKYYNRLIWALPNGEIAYYDKRHLFSFAGEHAHYTAGNKRLIAQVSGWKVALFICYDLRFPLWLRQGGEQDTHYDLMVVVANWPATRISQWNALLKARAIENQCFVAGLNRIGTDGMNLDYNGHSSFYDPMGEKTAFADNREVILRQTLRKETITEVRRQFPFLEDTDQFIFNPG